MEKWTNGKSLINQNNKINLTQAIVGHSVCHEHETAFFSEKAFCLKVLSHTSHSEKVLLKICFSLLTYSDQLQEVSANNPRTGTRQFSKLFLIAIETKLFNLNF